MARKAALYLRSSKDRHDVSVESQRRELTEFVQKQGHAIVAEFVDKVESAKTDERPGFQEMIAEVKTKQCRFDIVYCFDTARFARRQYHAQMYKHLLKRQNIELVFLKLPKTDTILDPIIESLMEAFDQFHSEKSKMDGLRGMRENIEQGWRAGGRATLGYKLEQHVVGTREGQPITKSRLVPDYTVFEKMQAYLKARARGLSRKAAMAEYDLDVPYTTLVYIEQSALTYAGHTVWNRHAEVVEGKYVGGKKFRPRAEWVVKRNTHEPTITDEEAEAILDECEHQRQKNKRRRKNNYLLSGLLTCTCGSPIHAESGYYRCQSRCGAKSIKAETLEEAVVEVVFAEMLTAENIHELQKEIEAEHAARSEAKPNIVEQLKRELKDIERQVKELVALLPQVKHQRPLIERMDSLEDERTALEARIGEEKGQARPTFLQLDSAGLLEFVQGYRGELTSGNAEAKKAILRGMIASAEFDGEALKINPSYESVTGVKLASRRGVEPLSSP